MLVTVLGSSGRTGRHVVQALRRHGYQVRAGVRSLSRGAEPARLGAKPVLADLASDPGALVEAFTGAAAVINVAGAQDPEPSVVNLVDRDGAIAAIRAAEQAGVRRFLQLSAQFADSPDQGDRLVRTFLLAKQISASVLRRSSLVWTIVRPGTLLESPGTGRVMVASHLGPGRVPRRDVAALLVAALGTRRTERCGFDVIGGAVPIPAALAAFE